MDRSSAATRRVCTGIALSALLAASACAGGSTAETVDTGQAVASETAPADVATTTPIEAPATETANDNAAPAEPSAEPATEAPADDETASEAETASTTGAPDAAADTPAPATDAGPTAVPATAVPPTPVPATAVPPTAVPQPEPTEPPPAASGLSLPSVDVVNLATGQTANLNSFTRPGATLVWFWAPH